MNVDTKKFAPPYEHDSIAQLYENIYWVHGSIRIGPGISMNRNMVIVREGNFLFLINPVRLNSVEEKKLQELGKIKAIIRLGDFHGLDDEYYVSQFDAEFWCQDGQSTYMSPKPDKIIDSNTAGPVSNSKFFLFSSAKFPEGALLLENHKLLVTTDSVQYWSGWSHTTWITKMVLKAMGFKIGLLIGKPWLKRVTPKGQSMRGEFEELLKLDFDNLIAAHGTPLIGGARNKLLGVVAKTFG